MAHDAPKFSPSCPKFFLHLSTCLPALSCFSCFPQSARRRGRDYFPAYDSASISDDEDAHVFRYSNNEFESLLTSFDNVEDGPFATTQFAERQYIAREMDASLGEEPSAYGDGEARLMSDEEIRRFSKAVEECELRESRLLGDGRKLSAMIEEMALQPSPSLAYKDDDEDEDMDDGNIQRNRQLALQALTGNLETVQEEPDTVAPAQPDTVNQSTDPSPAVEPVHDEELANIEQGIKMSAFVFRPNSLIELEKHDHLWLAKHHHATFDIDSNAGIPGSSNTTPSEFTNGRELGGNVGGIFGDWQNRLASITNNFTNAIESAMPKRTADLDDRGEILQPTKRRASIVDTPEGEQPSPALVAARSVTVNAADPTSANRRSRKISTTRRMYRPISQLSPVQEEIMPK
ncbi:uncharacterized protein VTP21DRAFT_11133 [Calcarisporiella thermophila]|uniref:uncharacterized protein n=1 Tax=Calcarisporiella thermophila TaxID=911321 RepID=UPI00374464CC